MAVRAQGLAVTAETARREEASGAEAAAVGALIVVPAAAAVTTVAVALTVGDMTVVVTNVVAEVDLPVWGKLHSATTPQVSMYLYTSSKLLLTSGPLYSETVHLCGFKYGISFVLQILVLVIFSVSLNPFLIHQMHRFSIICFVTQVMK